ncbi:MAG: hypothetical protein AAF962_27505 [Actinomycetota bacterium]
MGFWQQVKGWLSSEAAELSDAAKGFEARADREMTAREQRLNETPAEAMERLTAESSANDSLFDELEDKIAASQAKADAVADLAADAENKAADTAAADELVIPEDETEEQ